MPFDMTNSAISKAMTPAFEDISGEMLYNCVVVLIVQCT